MCILGNRLLKDIDLGNCTKDRGSGLWNIFCEKGECDEYFKGKFARTLELTYFIIFVLSLFRYRKQCDNCTGH